ncbi:MAG: hypothetical protein KME60_11855 [Cyanomargarita calcarea GSE-NOS-MK-12-04C]|jgi:hypothetical protein|uniref:Uncharacterized protein n=1 Tax=Cyanomargarita calcarea GSE-NOS-MK-12-04C TaxID=2839659 RepID=A0A951QL84_9CYAN|nr:hypothetical protein [Cyanomargarita calcarea GSE-NOS-MK-12-04C]
MNAYKVDAIVTEDGLAILERLPLPVGSSVEVIILDNGMLGQKGLLPQKAIFSQPALQPEYLLGISSLMTEWESAADESAYQDI